MLPVIRYQQNMARERLALLRARRIPATHRRIAPAPEPVQPLVTVDEPQPGPNDSDFDSVRVRGIVQGQRPLVFLEFTQDETTGIFREGDRAGALTVIAIGRDSVIVANARQQRTLKVALDGPESAFCRHPSEYETVINRKMLGGTALKLAGEANGVKLAPVGGPQRPTGGGLQITNVTQGGIIEEIGLKNNDILTQVNGIRLDNLFSLINIAQKLKTSKTIELEIVRNNVPLMLKYSVR